MRHRQRRGMLKMYYGVGEETGKSTAIDYCDINGAHFKPDEFLEKLFKEKSLNELMDKEVDIAKRKYSMTRGGGHSHIKMTRVLTGNFQKTPQKGTRISFDGRGSNFTCKRH